MTQRQRFAEEYLLDCDPAAAAERVGLPPGAGPGLLARPDVQTAVKLMLARRASRTEIYADATLRRWWMLATADARELTGILRVNCRWCHGIDHRYQYTLDELRTARQKHEVEQRRRPDARRRVEFDDLGGDGFDPWGDPDPECTECAGHGVPQVWVADTRTLSPAAALLYDGVEVGRDGAMRVKMRDRAWADQMVAAHLGIAVRGNRDPPAPVDPARMSDEQLAMAVEAFERSGLLDADDEDDGDGQGDGAAAETGEAIEDVESAVESRSDEDEGV